MIRKIVFISPGPTWRPKSPSYQRQFLSLSKHFEGYILTTSSIEQTVKIGNFTFISCKADSGIIAIIKFIFFCLRNASIWKKRNEKIDLVTTYDPLKSGITGLILARYLKTKLAPEVNGVYTSAAEWMDEADTTLNKIKRRIVIITIGIVLKQSDGIKLLFKTQIDPFKSRIGNKYIRAFPCYTATEQFSHIEEKKEILFVGFPFYRKGVDILMLAFKKIASQHPDWRLKILGWFPDQEQIDAAIGGHPQIFHNPPVHHHEMPEHIGSCAILVLPSRSEAMGRVLVEAMAASKPRVGARVDGIPTVIEDRVDGLLFAPENVDDLAAKLDLLMGSSELRKKYGHAGFLRAKESFTEEAYIKNVFEFYSAIIAIKSTD